MCHKLSLATFYRAVERVIAPALSAIGAFPADFDDRANLCKTGMFGRCANVHGQYVVINMRGSATAVADQENAVVQTAGMRVGEIGVRAFDAARKVGGHEQIEYPVHAVGCNALAAFLRNQIGNIISRCGFFKCGEHGEDIRAHIGPLLACLDQRRFGGMGKRRACMLVMMMNCHIDDVGCDSQSVNCPSGRCAVVQEMS